MLSPSPSPGVPAWQSQSPQGTWRVAVARALGGSKNILELIDWFELSSPSKPLVMITELPSKTLKQ